MRAIFIAGLIGVSTTAHAEPVTDGQLTAATLRLITHISLDAFDAAPAADFSGRTFVIEVPVSEFAYDTFKCQPNWTYARDAGVLKVTVQQGLASTYMMRRGPGAALVGAAAGGGIDVVGSGHGPVQRSRHRIVAAGQRHLALDAGNAPHRGRRIGQHPGAGAGQRGQQDEMNDLFAAHGYAPVDILI